MAREELMRKSKENPGEKPRAEQARLVLSLPKNWRWLGDAARTKDAFVTVWERVFDTRRSALARFGLSGFGDLNPIAQDRDAWTGQGSYSQFLEEFSI